MPSLSPVSYRGCSGKGCGHVAASGHNSGPACGARVFPPALQVGLWVHSAIVVELLCTSTFFLSLQGSHGLPGSTL